MPEQGATSARKRVVPLTKRNGQFFAMMAMWSSLLGIFLYLQKNRAMPHVENTKGELTTSPSTTQTSAQINAAHSDADRDAGRRNRQFYEAQRGGANEY